MSDDMTEMELRQKIAEEQIATDQPTPPTSPVVTEQPKTAEEIALDIEREKQVYEIRRKITADPVLNDLNEIFQSMFVWYIDNINFEYIFTDKKNRRDRKKKNKKKKSFNTNLEELELDIQDFVNMCENKTDLFRIINYDESWYEADSLKPKLPPASAKELYVEENMQSISQEEKKEQKDAMIQKLNEQWTRLDESNREIYKKQFFKTKEKYQLQYEESKQNYLGNKRIEMAFIPYYYRYFIVIFQKIYTKYFTYEYINQGKNTNLFISVIIVIMASLKNSLNDTNNINSISEIIKLIHSFIYKIRKITDEQNQTFEKKSLESRQNIKHIKESIEQLKNKRKIFNELSQEQQEQQEQQREQKRQEQQMEKLFNELDDINEIVPFLVDYNKSSNMLATMMEERLIELSEEYKEKFIDLEVTKIPPEVEESEFRKKMKESIETILFHFEQTFLKINDKPTDSFYKYITNSYENIYLVRKDMESFPSLKEEFDLNNLQERARVIDAATAAGKAAAVKLEALKAVEETKKCEICGKTGKANFSKAQWGKPTTEIRKCK
jgi:hypothetical protein